MTFKALTYEEAKAILNDGGVLTHHGVKDKDKVFHYVWYPGVPRLIEDGYEFQANP